jgi:hypothetical protein
MRMASGIVTSFPAVLVHAGRTVSKFIKEIQQFSVIRR